MERITAWVEGEMPRARQLAEAAAEQARLADIEREATRLESVTMCECVKLIEAGESEDKILDVILRSGLDAARQESQKVIALKSLASKKKKMEAEARRSRTTKLIDDGEKRIRAGHDLDLILQDLPPELTDWERDLVATELRYHSRLNGADWRERERAKQSGGEHAQSGR